ncbi:MAG: hypothetical protein R3E12_13515 [Candidatus Eisenbacteria bacterium]|uniref:Redoxin domain-containing protein n=1 Tax=Eiseniibacteriota bacterium TaxID=2212470 RepID=A0A956M0Q2_UNCEI|nr:hypothetical protein [Candidatus Eisenbacteria bacterium]
MNALRVVARATLAAAALMLAAPGPGRATDLTEQDAVADATAVPENPSEVCSIPIGTEVPSVTVRDLDGQPQDLHDVVSAQPTILIFYRGGW